MQEWFTPNTLKLRTIIIFTALNSRKLLYLSVFVSIMVKIKKADRTILKLSDSFPEGSDPDIEVKVTMININYGQNKELMEACQSLKDYSWLVDKIRSNKKIMGNLEQAVDAALAAMPNDSVIKTFLLENQAEVKRMCITEYNEEKVFAQQRDEGKAEGVLETLISLVEKGLLSLTQAAEEAHMTTEEFEKKTGLNA